jgi:negative regulator of flagellin synthesis FlgM
MRISDAEVQRILQGRHAIVAEIIELEEGIDETHFDTDPKMVKAIVKKVMEMPDREDMIADLKARIEAGTYNPSGDEIAEAMIRRAIADKVR